MHYSFRRSYRCKNSIMKTLLLFLFPFALCAQINVMPVKSEFTTKLLPYKFFTGFVSGGSRGLREVISFHPDRFFERYPGANRYYWDNDIAWLNKYKNRDPSQGPACFGCTTFLAWTRDGLHFTGTLSNVSGVVSLSLPLYKGPDQTIWQYLAEIGISSFGYWLGFHWVYTLWFP